MEVSTRKSFLIEQVPALLQKLGSDTVPSFGLMTPQHMVEHLTWFTKSTVKRNGEPNGELTKGALRFKKFIENGAIFKHFPSEKTVDDLPPLKYSSLDEALVQIPVAINRFYTHFETNPSFKFYHSRMGELSFDKLELIHFQHYRYHFWQFGLLEQYP